MTRTWLKPLAALALLGAVGLATAVPAQAQVYFEGPGFDVGVGAPWHYHHYYGPYHHHYWRHHYYYRDWD